MLLIASNFVSRKVVIQSGRNLNRNIENAMAMIIEIANITTSPIFAVSDFGLSSLVVVGSSSMNSFAEKLIAPKPTIIISNKFTIPLRIGMLIARNLWVRVL